MVLEVCGHSFTCIQAGLEFCVGNVTGHDYGSLKVHAGTYGIFGKFCAHCVNTLIKVYLNPLGAFAGTAEFLRDEF